MVLRIRLQRFGRRARPFYRVILANARTPRNGKFIELLGTYNPIANKAGIKEVSFKVERIRYWIGIGAKPSGRIEWLLGQFGILPPKMVPVALTKQHLRRNPDKKRRNELREEAAAAEAAAAEAAAAEAAKSEQEPAAGEGATSEVGPAEAVTSAPASGFHTTAFAAAQLDATYYTVDEDIPLRFEAGGPLDVPVVWGTGGVETEEKAGDTWGALSQAAIEHNDSIGRASVRGDGASEATAAFASSRRPFFASGSSESIASLQRQLEAASLKESVENDISVARKGMRAGPFSPQGAADKLKAMAGMSPTPTPVFLWPGFAECCAAVSSPKRK